MSIINIRQGVFETNSSSMHTLCINKNELNVPSEYTFPFAGQYGWEQDTYSGSYDTGAYFYQILKDQAWKEGKNRFMCSDEFLNNKEQYESKDKYWYFWPEKFPEYKKYIDDVETEYKSIIEKILSDYGCTYVEWEPEDNDRYIYIDHIDELGTFYNDMINHPELLIHFLFGNSFIETGNDNDYPNSMPNEYPESDYQYIKGQ